MWYGGAQSFYFSPAARREPKLKDAAVMQHKKRHTGTEEGLTRFKTATNISAPVVIEEEIDPDMYLGVEPPVEIHVTQRKVDRKDAMLIIPRPD